MICDYSECDNEFEPRTHNQKYCSDECCKIATSIKIKEKYQKNKDRLAGKVRRCATHGCKYTLSKYNTSDYCAECENKDYYASRKQMLKELGL